MFLVVLNRRFERQKFRITMDTAFEEIEQCSIKKREGYLEHGLLKK